MAADNGTGPPAGSSSASPYAQQIPASQYTRAIEQQLGGGAVIRQDDPAFQPPHDPLLGRDKNAVTRIVPRDLPLVESITTWTVDQIRSALRSHVWGIYEWSGQLCDAVLGDDRVQATLGSLLTGLFSRELQFKPANDSLAAKECCDAWVKIFPSFETNAAASQMSAYAKLMGWMPATINWDTDGPIACPYLYPWHPRYTYYHWPLRKYVALTQDGQMPIIPGNGKWMLYAPYGEYRGWIRGAIRAVAFPWLMRHWALRDWARFAEKHGIPIVKATCPASAEQGQRDAFATALTQMATETTIMVSEGNDGTNRYDVEIVEPKDTAWEAFPGLRDHCDMAIVLALMMQNLTTEVKGGSFAATSSHMDIRQGGIQAENSNWYHAVREQVARPFAWLNFGDASLAPYTTRDVTPREEYASNADQFAKFGTAIEVLRRGGVKFSDSEQVKRFARERFGLAGLPDFEIVDPVAAGGAGGGGFGK